MENVHLFLFEGFPKGASVQCNGEVEAVVRAGCVDGNVEGGGEEPHHLILFFLLLSADLYPRFL